MSLRNVLPALLLGAGLLGLLGWPAGAAEKPDQARIAELVKQLGSDTFADRQKATDALEAIGEPALDALRKAAKSTDAEVRKRAGALVEKIELRVKNARVLGPRMVHLVYKDTPLVDAVADFAKKSGYVVVLYDPDGKRKGKKITLDTGNVTFWNAMEQFCTKAGVIESDPNAALMPAPRGGGAVAAPALPVPPGGAAPPAAAAPKPPARGAGKEAKKEDKKEEKRPGVARPAGPAAVVPRGFQSWVSVVPGQITLMPGQRSATAVDTASAVRVRASDKKNYRISDDEIALVLEISPEPRLRWQEFRSASIDKTIDDNDQKLAQVAAQGGAGVPGTPRAPGGGSWLPSSNNNLTHHATIRLKKGDKETKSLKELTGVVAAQLLGDAEPLVVADNVMKAAGKSFKGKPDGEMKILSAEKKDDGSFEINFVFELPPNVTSETQVNVPAPAAAAKKGDAPGAIIPANAPTTRFAFNGLTLRDDKGNLLNASITFNWKKAGGFAPGNRRLEYVATYKPTGRDPAEPAQLVYTGRRSVTINVPFTLKDVVVK
jgi:hypothetical protein